MKIFRIRPYIKDEFAFIDVRSSLDIDFIDEIVEGNKMSENQVENKMKLKNKTKIIPDILGTSSADVFINDKVKRLFEENIKDLEINYIPMEIEGKSYWLLNVIGLLDCFDYENSNYTKFKDGFPDKIHEIQFIEDKVPEMSIFRIEEEVNFLFISNKLKDILDNNNITGYKCSDNMNLTEGF